MKNVIGMAKVSELKTDGTVPKIKCGICGKLIRFHGFPVHHNKCKRSTKRLNKSKFDEYKRSRYKV